MTTPQLKQFTAPLLLNHIGHAPLGHLFRCLTRLFPGDYKLPYIVPENEFLASGLAERLASPEDLPAPMLQVLAEIENLTAPENIAALNIPQNVDPQAPEAAPLYHAIFFWLGAHPDPPAVAPAAEPRARAAEPVADARSTPRNGRLQPISVPQPQPPDNSPDADPPDEPHWREPDLLAGDGPPLPRLRMRLSILFHEIDPIIRHEFFLNFEPQLRAAFPELPARSYDKDDFDLAVYALLKKPAFLPYDMRAALLAIQELAAKPNRQLLRALVDHHGIYCNASAAASHYAVALWLRHPFLLGDFPVLHNRVRHRLEAQPPKIKSPAFVPDPESEPLLDTLPPGPSLRRPPTTPLTWPPSLASRAIKSASSLPTSARK